MLGIRGRGGKPTLIFFVELFSEDIARSQPDSEENKTQRTKNVFLKSICLF